jgi:hypothetical protein
VLSISAVITGCVVAIVDRVRAEGERQRLAKALSEAETERNAHALAGRFGNQEGVGQIYQVGDSGPDFFVAHGGSVLSVLPLRSPFRRIAEENSVISKTVAGRLLVSARIRGRDGLLAEINDNEWKVSSPPRSWDRNYSTNALEVKDADGNIVFQIRLQARAVGLPSNSVVSFQGIFFGSDGNAVALTGNAGGSQMTILFTNSAAPLPMPRIKPLFKYPSSIHLGEPAGSD